MKDRTRTVLIAASLALLAAGSVGVWNAIMVKRVEPIRYESDAARENPELAATRLLTRQGHPVRIQSMLDLEAIETLPGGTLLLPTADGDALDRLQGEQLLAWVRRGNTLIMSPGYRSNKGHDDKTQADEEGGDDVIGARFGVYRSYEEVEDKACDAAAAPRFTARQKPDTSPAREDALAEQASQHEASDKPEGDAAPSLACVTPPAGTHPLELDARRSGLQSSEDGPTPLWQDTEGGAVQVFAEGKGRVALLATDYFDNDNLQAYDHGELLLILAGLNGPHAPVLIVQRIETPGWMAVLWRRFAPVLTGCATLLLLWLWGASRRFGPMLPEQENERRSLMEHIEASGRWLWKLPAGRELLLGAVRARIERLLLRRAPQLRALPAHERAQQLASICKLHEADVHSALHQPASGEPARFTRQISTLQQLRIHYER
jgi:hypothetical protein